MDKFEALEKQMCKELEAIEHKLQGGTEMSETDLKQIDMLAHAMKSLATYTAMKEAEETGYGMSERRGRGMDGRYVSRDESSYADGYAQGFSEAMSRYPMTYPR